MLNVLADAFAQLFEPTSILHSIRGGDKGMASALEQIAESLMLRHASRGEYDLAHHFGGRRERKP